jgi:glycosyltransferase involved in cell wall biosynthesis
LKRLSVVIPVFFNGPTLEQLHQRLLKLEGSISNDVRLEIIFVDDGSGDNSRQVLAEIARMDPCHTRLVFLSRNFGSFNAILAGLHYATGDCTAIISADLQDPPEMIGAMYEQWQAGNQTVMALREKREDPLMTRLFSKITYAVLRKLALRDFPKDGFDFVLLDRKIINIIVGMGERNAFLMGLVVWVGFKQSQLFYTRQTRAIGRSRWTFAKKVKYFIDSLLAFSYAPIRIMSVSGIVIGFLGLCFAVFLVILRLLFRITVPGWTALMVTILVLFGFQFLALGVIGEYLWRTLDEVRHRPAFIVDKVIGWESEEQQEGGRV